MAPLFSIIIPTYNRASLLLKAIGSLKNQTFENWELIIIDDGSTDDTKALVNSITDYRIRYFYQNNQERSAARNAGIEEAVGDYITFLDSDDYYLPERLEKLYGEIKKRNYPVAFFYTGNSYEEAGKISKREESKYEFNTDLDFVICGIIGTPQACIHRTILSKHRFNENIHISEDMELWIRIVCDGYSLNFIEQYDIVTTIHSGRSVYEFNDRSFYYEMVGVLKFIFSKKHPGNVVSPKSKKFAWSSVFFGLARFHIFRKNRWRALYYLCRSLLINPRSPHSKHKIFLIFNLLIRKKSNLAQIYEFIG